MLRASRGEPRAQSSLQTGRWQGSWALPAKPTGPDSHETGANWERKLTGNAFCRSAGPSGLLAQGAAGAKVGFLGQKWLQCWSQEQGAGAKRQALSRCVSSRCAWGQHQWPRWPPQQVSSVAWVWKLKFKLVPWPHPRFGWPSFLLMPLELASVVCN